ncbi:MAG: DNA polymerase IV [Candidatus Kaiserbacteria bacterium]|nr:DNA polymerase IV [Candidatus Kaiserbacteria bacterium]
MAWGSPRSFPRAILHIDGDSFFASCEVAKDLRLKGRPVVTGKERGIASSMSYEAKRMGVKRGMILSDILKVCPDAIILPSDYETYSLFSNRMYEIVRRYSSAVEEYSIDECFADLTGLRQKLRMKYPEMAARIKKDLEVELGMTFSMGLSATKVLAKLGSRWKKPDGLTVIPLHEAKPFLQKTPAIKVWGIGPNTAGYLDKFGIKTAFDFAAREERWVKESLSKPGYELWRELNGEVVSEIDAVGRETYQSISKTKTFTPPSRDPKFVFSQLSKNIENACIKARRWGLSTPEVFFFLKTQDFKYHSCEIKLSHATCVPQDILKVVTDYFPQIFRPRTLYRATGIGLLKLQDSSKTQLDLFGGVLKSEAMRHIYESVDEICERYGKHTVFLASSFGAMTHAAHLGARGDLPTRTSNLMKGETFRQRLNLPLLGEV